LIGLFNVDNGQTFRAVCNVGVGAGEIESLRAPQWNRCGGDGNRSGGIGDIEYFQTVRVSDEGITELDCNGSRFTKETGCDLGND